MVSLSKWGNQDETHSSGRELLVQFLSDLLVGEVQSHEVEAQDPDP